MVKPIIISHFCEHFPESQDEAARKIAKGPLYPTGEVLEILANQERAFIPWTKQCMKDIRNLEFDDDALIELLKLAVCKGRFVGAEWCEQKSGGPWAACDAYAIVRREYIANAHKEMDMEYYIKFAISQRGKLLLLVSCHPSR